MTKDPRRALLDAIREQASADHVTKPEPEPEEPEHGNYSPNEGRQPHRLTPATNWPDVLDTLGARLTN